MPRYRFDPQELQEAANLGASMSMGQRWDPIHDELRRRHAEEAERGYPRTWKTA